MRTTVNKNSTLNRSHSAILRHSGTGLFSWHANGRTADALLPSQLQGIREFFSILSYDRRLLALLGGTVLTGLVLGGVFYMAAVTVLSRLAA